MLTVQPTAAQFGHWEAWLDSSLPAHRIPDLPVLVALLREHRAALTTAQAPLAFYPLPCGGFHIAGHNYLGPRLPRGLQLAWEAIRAAQAHTSPPAVTNAHAARKAIKTHALSWAEKHCPALVPVLQAIRVAIPGKVLFDIGRRGAPPVVCVSRA